RGRSRGIKPLVGVEGPTLTFVGRFAGGAPRAWYVRLWNYAEGAPDDAIVTIDFDALAGGFALPGEADPVWACDIDRLFLSLVAPDYDRTDLPLAAPVEGRVELSEMACDGPRSVLAIGDAIVPEHGLRIASGYDDSYHLTPARLLRTMLQLGYRKIINHYVGMSHYFRLASVGDGLVASLAGGALNAPCVAWHRDFGARAKALGYDLILSLSFELLDAHCPEAWKQRTAEGAPALTGWEPPSTLLSPASGEAMAYLRGVAQAFVGIAREVGQPVRFQIGEPWWWVTGDGRICLYDAAARAAFGGAPVAIPNVFAPLDSAQTTLLDVAGALLAAATAGVRDAVKALEPQAEVLLLAYLPSLLDARAPEVLRANMPMGWARPAFDRLQLEDYDWVIAGDTAATTRGIEVATARLGYPAGQTHYLSGFVLRREDAAQWQRIDAAADAARARGHADVFVWAIPQVMRDGYVHFDIGEETEMRAFDDVTFPIAIGRTASAEPGFSTAVVTSTAGFEQRNADWAQGRMRFDAGPGVRSESDMQALLAFFRARRGRARGFRFRDPFDDSSNGMAGEPGFDDVVIGTGDGVRTRFPLIKAYGADEPERRRITRPVAGSVRIGIDGVQRLTGWRLEEGGVIAFHVAPAAGMAVTAGFRFDVPVRFEQDQLSVSRAAVTAGEAPSVPLIELREDFA
ncbi:DUF2460 domain-containing protein, partial [Sphingomonas sp.]|uniref:DUF2460 domain-containing protein n=1 Tax=Sphingomonas sp. TaxID=28214 RepID=UPI003B3A7288